MGDQVQRSKQVSSHVSFRLKDAAMRLEVAMLSHRIHKVAFEQAYLEVS